MKGVTIKDLDEIAKSLIAKAQKNKTDKAVVLTFSGELGSGKTTLTQALCRELGIREKITSPTFVIMKKYNINNGPFKKLIHIDAYRIETEKELSLLGWEEIMEDKDNIVIIEWPEKIIKIIPSKAIKIKLTHIDEHKRDILF